MALNIYAMEMNEKIYRGMGEFAEFLPRLNRIPQKVDPGSVLYTKLLEEVEPSLVTWKWGPSPLLASPPPGATSRSSPWPDSG